MFYDSIALILHNFLQQLANKPLISFSTLFNFHAFKIHLIWFLDSRLRRAEVPNKDLLKNIFFVQTMER